MEFPFIFENEEYKEDDNRFKPTDSNIKATESEKSMNSEKLKSKKKKICIETSMPSKQRLEKRFI